MSTLITTLATHQLEIIDGTCTCGDWGYGDVPEDASDPDLGEMHAAHVAAVIAETHAIVELPKPDGTGRWTSKRGNKDDGYITWSVGVNGIPYARAHRGPGDISRAVTDHIAFAAAILAATSASEVSS